MNKRTWTDEDLLEAVSSSRSIRQTLLKLGLSSNGSYETVKKYIKKLHIPTVHFCGKSWLRGNSQDWRKKPLSNYLVQGLTNYWMLKKRLIEERAIPYECTICNIGPEWKGKKLVLQLDHKNGNRLDNRIENLRFMCPNCHSQTETYAGKKEKKEIKKQYRPRPGSRKPKPWLRKTVRPTSEELLSMINGMSWRAIGKKYGVSDNAVRKWAKYYGLL